jgi:hypothetical protein
VRDRGFSSFFLSSSAAQPPLRIGVLLGHRVDRATAAILQDLLAADYLRVVVVLVDAGPVHAATTSWKHLAWNLYIALDRRRVQLADDPLSPVDRATALPELDIRPVVPIPDGADRRLPAAVADDLRSARLDVVLQLGMDDVNGHFDTASSGTWALRRGDGDRYVGDPPHLWEMVDDAPTTAVTLERRADDPAATLVLASAHFPTDRGSLLRNRVQPTFGSAFLVIRSLWQLHQFGWTHLEAWSQPAGAAAACDARSGSAVRTGIPSNGVVIRWLLPRALSAVRRRLAARLLARDEIEHWQMAIRVVRPGLDRGDRVDLTGFRWIESPRGRFYADPFLLEREGRTWLFFEDCPYGERRGVISCAEVDPAGQLGPVQVVLSTPGHLSYPYVFLEGGDAWMIPESSAEGNVRLFRATDFPQHWVEHAGLLSRPALDSSIWKQDDRWWLFTSLREPRGGATMLWLFHAESVAGGWIAHPMNPISMDVRTSRGAGLIHRHDGRLIRPSQDGSRGYGSSFGLNEITTLSTTDFVERPLISVGPDWAPRMLATHTYNRSGPFEVIDAKFLRARRDVQ